MHIETLKTFCDIVDLNSFLRSGRKNSLSQSAVSQQLAQLEHIFSCRLLDRKKKPFQLTACGELFYHAAKDIVERYEKFSNDLDAFKKTAANRINVAAIYSIGMHTLPTYIKAFMAKYPKINVHIEYLSSSRIHDLVLRDVIDIGLVAVPREHRNIKVFLFENELLVFVCSPEHFLADKSEIDIHLLNRQNFIGFADGIPTRELIDGILKEYDVSVRKVMEFDNIETVKRAVEIGAGISILPETAVRQELESGTLKAISLSNNKFARPTGIIIRKDKILSRPARHFLQLLRRRKDKS